MISFSEFIQWYRPIMLNYPELKNITFRSEKIVYRSIYWMLNTSTDAQIDIEMGSKQVAVCNASENFSIMYFWNAETDQLQAIRFDSLLISLSNYGYAFDLDKRKEVKYTKCRLLSVMLIN